MNEQQRVIAHESPRKRRRERLVALCVIGILLLNYPLLSLFSLPRLWLGIPVLYWYIFLTWIGLILLSFWVLEVHRYPKSHTPPD